MLSLHVLTGLAKQTLSINYCSPEDTCWEEKTLEPSQGKPGEVGTGLKLPSAHLTLQAFIVKSLSSSEEWDVCVS